MNLLENAITSLNLALEDYSSLGDGRLLSAVRNLHAGILLLYKEKLRQLSPPGSDDVLVKAKNKFQKGASGAIISVGAGKKTADVAQIRERFTALGIKTHWDRFDKVNELRNDVEHYFTIVNRGSMEAMISNTFIIIRDFIHHELGEDPKELLGDDAWSKLLSVSEVVEKEHEVCQKALTDIDWDSPALAEAILHLGCAECGSPLLLPVKDGHETNLQCRSCGEEESFEKYAGRAISGYFAKDNFRSLKDGGDPVSITCPHCSEEGYIVEENRCVICGESCETTCSVCGNRIPVEELNDGSLCGYCDHMLSKDD
jgi:DNA-directed RNA polymerase subunit M/transcription elongation factor TFIIS